MARALHAEAPGATLVFEQVGPGIADDTGAVLSAVDGLLMPHGIISGFPTVELYRDEWVCVIADGHPEVGETITMDDLARLPWAVYQRPYDAPAASCPCSAWNPEWKSRSRASSSCPPSSRGPAGSPSSSAASPN
ncbi:hypothetical protein [Actinomadura geliboluensis]